MPLIYYNEWNQEASAWLRSLSGNSQLPRGVIDERSITEIDQAEIKDYDQAHFFTGIGGWPLALRWAGLETFKGIWTGSCPCQPFSSAGRKKGMEDERHLWPVWRKLIAKCKPSIIFGEQVESAIKDGWLDLVSDDLEKEGYVVASAILPACSVGAPHLRKRIFFGAVRLEDACSERFKRKWLLWRQERRIISCRRSQNINMADKKSLRSRRRSECRVCDQSRPLEQSERFCASVSASNAKHDGSHRQKESETVPRENEQASILSVRDHSFDGLGNACCKGWYPSHSVKSRLPKKQPEHSSVVSNDNWRDEEWVYCTDDKIRPIPTEPALQPLSDGISYVLGAQRSSGILDRQLTEHQVNKLRRFMLQGAGNAIVPQVAHVFIEEFMNSIGDL